MYIRGRALYYSGNFPHAISYYSEALRLDPDFSKARLELKKVKALERTKQDGNDAFAAGRYQDALNFYTEALAVDPNLRSFNAQLYCNRAAAGTKVCLLLVSSHNSLTLLLVLYPSLYTITSHLHMPHSYNNILYTTHNA